MSAEEIISKLSRKAREDQYMQAQQQRLQERQQRNAVRDFEVKWGIKSASHEHEVQWHSGKWCDETCGLCRGDTQKREAGVQKREIKFYYNQASTQQADLQRGYALLKQLGGK